MPAGECSRLVAVTVKCGLGFNDEANASLLFNESYPTFLVVECLINNNKAPKLHRLGAIA
ncbi:hypothetical protein [Prochlorococcus sp. MIT 1306]|uniref:hypothetical protein n=1 Tax=Prochlorococcus sp. MIT 1306 TaxID=1799667 RepID=UPI0007BBCD40|nr:hypothetical protein [Prochlorococcus sp. MIT 1306]KZR64942.1 hypothetical protein PMIT1306_00620 [Prochlorococcus sp. MIT 1306]